MILSNEPRTKIYFDKKLPKKKRLWVSAGVEAADLSYDRYMEMQYSPGTFRPRRPWLPATEEEERGLLSGDRRLDLKRNIALISIPASLESLLRQIGLGSLQSIEEAKRAMVDKKELFKQINAELQAFVIGLTPEEAPAPYVLGIFYMRPGLSTVGTRNGWYSGLHIDNGHAFRIDEMEDAPNRMCINIGSEERALLFADRPACDIYDELRLQKSIDVTKYKEFHLAADYFSINTERKIIKLRQCPFEAYIAPTDNLIHDGCTEDMQKTDVTLVVIGNFQLHVQKQTDVLY